jgi:hypothetical protein
MDLVRALVVVASAFATTEAAMAQTRLESAPLAHLDPDEFERLVSEIAGSAFDAPASWRGELEIRRIALGAGTHLYVRGRNLLCGATGNCQVWLLERARGRWRLLWRGDRIVVAEGVRVLAVSSHGLRDIEVLTNMSADERRRERFRYDGRLYRPASEAPP